MRKKEALLIDLTQLEPIDKLDEEEQSIHDELTQGKLTLHTDQATKGKYAQIFKASNHKRRALSLRMPENDYIGIKTKALTLGMPYQALINSVIHQYLTGVLHA
jgi:predicted DNA binding CopG/RHH family protein